MSMEKIGVTLALIDCVKGSCGTFREGWATASNVFSRYLCLHVFIYVAMIVLRETLYSFSPTLHVRLDEFIYVLIYKLEYET